jgi:RNA polymerase sigma-70 factor (ECF subfamily)
MNVRELALSFTVPRPRDEPAAIPMVEEDFRAFYEQTAHPLLSYLTRASGSPEAARDLLQDAYFHLLRARNLPAEELGRKKYLFRIATNLLRDHWRRSKRQRIAPMDAVSEPMVEPHFELDSNLRGAFDQLQPRERQMLWLAYVEEYDHREIAAITGLRHSSIRMLLFRARHKLAALLRAGTHAGKAKSI